MKPAHITLTVGPELCVSEVSHFRHHIAMALESADTVKLEMTAVSELDGAGVQLILSAQREASAAGKRLQISSPSDQVRQTLQLVGLNMLDHEGVPS